MADEGHEEIIEYYVVTLPKTEDFIDSLSLKQTLRPAYGEAVILQGISSVAIAYRFFAELIDKVTEIAFRESAESEVSVIRSYLPERYIHPNNVTVPAITKGNGKTARKKPIKGENNNREIETVEISLSELWLKNSTSSTGKEHDKTLQHFLDSVRDAISGNIKVRMVGEIPLLPALRALDLCWSLTEEIYYDNVKLK